MCYKTSIKDTEQRRDEIYCFAIEMARLTNKIKKESPRTMMFANDIDLCGRST